MTGASCAAKVAWEKPEAADQSFTLASSPPVTMVFCGVFWGWWWLGGAGWCWGVGLGWCGLWGGGVKGFRMVCVCYI